MDVDNCQTASQPVAVAAEILYCASNPATPTESDSLITLLEDVRHDLLSVSVSNFTISIDENQSTRIPGLTTDLHIQSQLPPQSNYQCRPTRASGPSNHTRTQCRNRYGWTGPYHPTNHSGRIEVIVFSLSLQPCRGNREERRSMPIKPDENDGRRQQGCLQTLDLLSWM